MKKDIVSVVEGDISQIPVDALITAVNSEQMWFGGIDGVIARVAGKLFHSQLAKSGQLKDGNSFLARGDERNQGKFANVIFVIDDLEKPLSQVVFKGLVTAHDAGFKSVSLPAIRLGVMRGAVEKSLDEAIEETKKGVDLFLSQYPTSSLKKIVFVIYSDQQVKSLFDKAF